MFSVFFRFSLRKKEELVKVVVVCVTLFSLFHSLRLFRLSDLFRVVSHGFLRFKWSIFCEFRSGFQLVCLSLFQNILGSFQV